MTGRKGRTTTVRIPVRVYRELEELVEEGYFLSTGEAVREAIRRLITEYRCRRQHMMPG